MTLYKFPGQKDEEAFDAADVPLPDGKTLQDHLEGRPVIEKKGSPDQAFVFHNEVPDRAKALLDGGVSWKRKKRGSEDDQNSEDDLDDTGEWKNLQS